ncbi:ATP-binding protein [Pararcticibacter amylolyticus]|uniref:histidine kinase n=1 Tax=Pararcticibacter amylolyticus TaxID=2173175 RepID=A0A2U2PF53_9SPHI|nr:ATP-binding protein [Pararcticibacter amylolyticus]PWG79892.1 ATPase [Pararcticibacter amylolyticus]
MGLKGFLSAVIALFSFLLSWSYAAAPSPVLASNGKIDLRKETFGRAIRLNGEWEFYWHELVTPGIPPKTKRILVDFPFKWNGFELNGEKLPSFGYATYRLTMLLPGNTEPLRIVVPSPYSAYKLFVNEKAATENGIVGTSPDTFKPYWHYRAVNIPGDLDTVILTLQVANFVHSKGGASNSIVLGKQYELSLDHQREQAIDFLLTGCLFMGGFFFLGLYLLGNKDKAILLFSLFSIIYSYRIIGTDNYELHTLLPDLSWYLTTRLEYITLFIGIGLFALYTRSLYPFDVNHTVVYIVAGICALFSFIALIFPASWFTLLINPFLLITVFCMAYLPYVYIVAWKRRRPGSVYSILGALALVPVFMISLLHYWDLIPSLQLISFIGYVIFFFFQSMVLSNRVSFILKKAKKEAEQGLVAKSEFLSTMSHEIRTPLNSVIGMSHILLQSQPRQDQVEQLEVLLFSANNLLSIVNDILDYSKIEAGKISFENIGMDLSLIAKNIVRGQLRQAQDKNIELRLKMSPALRHKKLSGDPTRIYQVISNLVSNAIKFTNSGYVELAIGIINETEETITLKFKVRDTGIGIPKEKQAVIFDRFTQADSSTSRSFGGTGLGLSICKRILELQNSSLQVISQEGKGSIFYFTQTFRKLTIPADAEETGKKLFKTKDKPFEGIGILLVEDNPMNVMVARKFLEKWGASVDVASNGLEALSRLDKEKHHLVLMDIHMPVMDGYESASRMRQDKVTIPIIALTADLPNETDNQIQKTGIDDIIIKPFLPDDLYRKVVQYCFNQPKGE